MIPVIYHFKTKSEIVQRNALINSEFIIQKFVESCVKLDASIFEPYIHEDDIFQDKATAQSFIWEYLIEATQKNHVRKILLLHWIDIG